MGIVVSKVIRGGVRRKRRNVHQMIIISCIKEKYLIPTIIMVAIPCEKDSIQVIEQIKRYEKLGYDEYAFWIDSGMSFKRKKESLERFINEVMPAFN